jgi:hypothetical protein
MNESNALKVANILKKKCPAFKYEPSNTAVWHGCDCKVNGLPCVCVWLLTDECNDGKWKELDFLTNERAKEQKRRSKALAQVIKARKATK